MRQISRSAIVSCRPGQMFALVADVESYPQFLPGCSAARIESRSEGQVVASLDLGRGPLHLRFSTRNTLAPPGSIHLELVDGPFRALAGEWRFTPLGEAGCRVSLALSFEFASRAQDLLLRPLFERTCNQLVDAFVARARDLHG